MTEQQIVLVKEEFVEWLRSLPDAYRFGRTCKTCPLAHFAKERLGYSRPVVYSSRISEGGLHTKFLPAWARTFVKLHDQFLSTGTLTSAYPKDCLEILKYEG